MADICNFGTINIFDQILLWGCLMFTGYLTSSQASSKPGELDFGVNHCHSCLFNIKTTNQEENVHSFILEKIIESLRMKSQVTGLWAWLTYPLKLVIFIVGPSLIS